jgi:diguanylate cyclase (GGDEF)-like protein
MQTLTPGNRLHAARPRRPLWGSEPVAAPEPFEKGWLLHLAQRLQVTLELTGLLEVYATECAPVIPFDGLSFQHEPGVLIEHGTRGPHSCSYTLLLSGASLGVVTYTRARPFSEADAARLEVLTSHLVYPLRNALLYREALVAATRDPLTGANNRANLEATLEREVSLAQRHGTPLSVIMLDLDHFKRINDRHGHATGDCVLRTLVARVGQCIRSSDALYRYGGEEFVIVLRSTDLRGAALLAERIRQAVESLTIECEAKGLRVTVSGGVATLALGDDAAGLLQRADKALYRSKSGGRNRVTAAT